MSAATTPPPPLYRKLTSMHRGVGLMSQLWLGSDHLLHVTSTGYTENYRRCYLRDIQSMLIVHTGRRSYIGIALSVVVLIVAVIMRSAGSGVVGYVIMAGVFLPFFIWNHLLGSGCRVVVITSTQQEKVPSLSRLPKTRRIMAELKPLIEAAQADLSSAPEEAGVRGAPAAAPVQTGSSLPPPLPPLPS